MKQLRLRPPNSTGEDHEVVKDTEAITSFWSLLGGVAWTVVTRDDVLEHIACLRRQTAKLKWKHLKQINALAWIKRKSCALKIDFSWMVYVFPDNAFSADESEGLANQHETGGSPADIETDSDNKGFVTAIRGFFAETSSQRSATGRIFNAVIAFSFADVIGKLVLLAFWNQINEGMIRHLWWIDTPDMISDCRAEGGLNQDPIQFWRSMTLPMIGDTPVVSLPSRVDRRSGDPRCRA